MRYVSLFSGIEAATVAWQPLGFEAVAFSEIDPFPCAVLQERFSDVPNLGDITQIDWRSLRGAVDLVVGGSPCQSFSVAGKRTGLEGQSGLMWEYIRAVSDLRPQWILWENVPGVFSIDKGRAFATLLCALEELGYGLAWRVLDAQFYGVAQRRRRVFLVGHASVGCAVSVLFECDSVSGNTQSSKEKRAVLTSTAKKGVRGCYSLAGNTIGRQECNGGNGTGYDEEVSYTLDTVDRHAVCFAENTHKMSSGYVVRRLTPTECERLQGFPDGWTDIEYKGKPANDGPRYKALGNSMAVPVMRWLGERIQTA